MFAVALMSTSCCKDDPVVPDLTLEEQYPDWVNLSWVSTDGVDATMNSNIYPRLNITIVGNDVTVNQPHSAPDPEENAYNGFYSTMSVSGADVIFGTPSNGVVGTFTVDGSQIILTTFGLMNTNDSENEHVYVLE